MKFVLALVAALVPAISWPAFGAECSYSQSHYEEYLATCAALDNCVLKEKMKAIVDRDCGTQATPPTATAQTRESQTAEKKGGLEASLSREQIAEIQQALNVLGYDAGPPDGVVGRRTRQAIAFFQERSGLPDTGEPSSGLMQRLADALQMAQQDENEPTSPKECNELLAYQQQLTSVLRATVAKHSVYKDLQGDLRRMRDELSNEAPWGIDTWRESTALILQGLNTVGRLTRNLTSFIPPADVAATTIGLAEDRIASSELWLARLRRGENIRKLFQDESEKLFFDLTVRLYGPTGKAIKTTTDLAEDLVKLKTMPNDFENMREQLADGVSRIDRQMRENEEKLLTNQQAAAMTAALYDAIDAYCTGSSASGVRLP